MNIHNFDITNLLLNTYKPGREFIKIIVGVSQISKLVLIESKLEININKLWTFWIKVSVSINNKLWTRLAHVLFYFAQTEIDKLFSCEKMK